jgi:hypothetical protein
MAEWLKILITALSAFVIGIMSEPVKTFVNEQVRIYRMRTALYRELRRVYRQIEKAFISQADALSVLSEIHLELYDYYCEKEQLLFLQMPDSWGLRRAFESVRLLPLQAKNMSLIELNLAIQSLQEALESDVKDGHLNETILEPFDD